MTAQIIRTDDGFMVILPNGDYLQDKDGNTLFDTHAEAAAFLKE